MAKKVASTTHMTGMERIAGTIFFLVYLLVMPLLASRLFGLAGTLLGVSFDAARRNILTYYILFVVTLLPQRAFAADRFHDRRFTCFQFPQRHIVPPIPVLYG